MKTKAVRLYGKEDLRLEDMILPEIDDDGVQVEKDMMMLSAYSRKTNLRYEISF